MQLTSVAAHRPLIYEAAACSRAVYAGGYLNATYGIRSRSSTWVMHASKDTQSSLV